MRDHPTTLAEAKAHRYNCWAGNPQGTVYYPERCAYTCHETGRSGRFYQCTKSPGHGPADLYCATHAAKLDGTNKTKGTKRVYRFASRRYKTEPARLYAFQVRTHGKAQVRIMVGDTDALPSWDVTVQPNLFEDTPEAALAAYRVRVEESVIAARVNLAAKEAELAVCPTEPGEPVTGED